MPRDEKSKDTICKDCGEDLGENVRTYTHIGDHYHKIVAVELKKLTNK